MIIFLGSSVFSDLRSAMSRSTKHRKEAFAIESAWEQYRLTVPKSAPDREATPSRSMALVRNAYFNCSRMASIRFRFTPRSDSPKREAERTSMLPVASSK